MHYVFVYNCDFLGLKSTYFSCLQDALDWIRSHEYCLTLAAMHRIKVYRCPRGFYEYLSLRNADAFPASYLISDLKDFIDNH